ncbi:MAG TPA: amidohydrolase family protein [Vicinamibacterales bacterium]
MTATRITSRRSARRLPGAGFVALVAAAGISAAVAAGQTPSAYVIEGARIVTLAGPAIENGAVLIRNGKIEAVGPSVQAPADAERIDGKGLHVYPGIFDAVSQLGLTEIGAVNATVDVAEAVPFTPQLVAAQAVHPASEHIPVARAGGITHAVAAPGLASNPRSPVVIGGQASAIHLSGWTVEEMLIEPSVGIVVNWPRTATSAFDLSTFSQRTRPFREVKEEYDRRVRELGEWIDGARRYARAIAGAPDTTERNLAFEALVPVVEGKRPFLVQAADKRQIRDAIEFSVARQLRLVLLGADEAREELDPIVKHRIPVILGPTQAMPRNEDDPYDAPYSLAGDLHKAGVTVSIATFNSADSRTLPFEAGHAVAYGLPWEEALRAITLNPARTLGLDDRLGTIEPGKVANLIVTTGDPLEIRTAIRHVFINGVPVSLSNRHLESYERWKSRPRPASSSR